VLYAYAALLEGVPYGNFTPSVAVDVPALASSRGGRASRWPARTARRADVRQDRDRARAARPRAARRGWYSHNILGNRDGLALRDRSRWRPS
jgi:myo-inositol-1-phosphate synthase